MKPRLVLLGGVIALGAAGLYALRGSDSNADSKVTTTEHNPSATAPAQARSTTTETGQPPEQPGAAKKANDVEHANVDGLPEELEPGWLAIEHAAKECYRGRPAATQSRRNGPDETVESIRLSYRQVVSGGVGYVEDLKVNHGELSDKALQTCILRVAALTTWPSTEPDRVLGDLEQNINIGDLMRPDHGPPPESKRSPKPTAPPPPELAAPLGTPEAK